jgi:hypothetical protein
LASLKKKGISVNDFAEGLAIALQKMRAENVESLEKLLPETIVNMSDDDLKKLDWELFIFDMFNINYACAITIGNEQVLSEALTLFHTAVEKQMIDISPLLATALQNESEAKYRTYDDAIHSSNPGWNLCKEAWRFILGQSCESALQMSAMSIYFKANQRFIMSFIKDIAEKHALADKWKIRLDLIDFHLK